MSDFTEVDTEETWLSDDDLATVRGRVPMVYVDAVPVRVDSIGEVTHIGLLLRAMADGIVIGMSRLPLANEGEALYHIARFDEIEEAETAIESFQSSLTPPPDALY